MVGEAEHAGQRVAQHVADDNRARFDPVRFQRIPAAVARVPVGEQQRRRHPRMAIDDVRAGHAHGGAIQRIDTPLRHRAPCIDHVRKPGQLHAAESGVEVGRAHVVARQDEAEARIDRAAFLPAVEIEEAVQLQVPAPPVGAQGIGHVRQLVAVGQDHPALDGGEVVAEIEAESAGRTQRADPCTAFRHRAHAFAGIFEQQQVVRGAIFGELGHVGGIAEHRHGDDHAGPLRHRGGDRFDAGVEAGRVDVAENGLQAEVHQRLERGRPVQPLDHDLVPRRAGAAGGHEIGAQPRQLHQRLYPHQVGGGAGVDEDRVPRAVPFREFPLEPRHARALRQPAAFQHLMRGGHLGIAKRVVGEGDAIVRHRQSAWLIVADCISCKSACSISRASSRTSVSWRQPSFWCALLGSPSSSSTSVGRK